METALGIWPPYEAFYLESLLYCTNSALKSVDAVRVSLEQGASHNPGTGEWNTHAETILNGIQNLAIQAAALSRYFWPARNSELHLARARHLREGLGIDDSSPIRNRDLRNQIEHFDEELDRLCSGGVVGDVFPQYVGPFPGDSEVPRCIFRAYFTDRAMFELLGRRYSMQPIADQIVVLHSRLRACCDSGHRIRQAGSRDGALAPDRDDM